jgi:poly-gamma-glutamate synthesis protein (capsule biosynthesis protein)
MKRTVQQLKSKNLDFLGTKETTNDPTYLVKDINGIKIGMVAFTYGTNGSASGADTLINYFSSANLSAFYSEAESVIQSMRDDGAEAIVFYMHWGNEYQRTQNTWQKTLAQKLSNMGVNMIIGGHPHVVQPIEYIYSEDGQTETVCVYSLGNAVSNQRRSLMQTNAPKGHTEDGLMVSYTLKKTADGIVTLVGFEAIPTWVDRYLVGGKYKYTIYPMENLENAKAKYTSIAAKLDESYQRTKEIMGKGLTEVQQKIGCEVTFNTAIE